jgi:hypothetical protein
VKKKWRWEPSRLTLGYFHSNSYNRVKQANKKKKIHECKSFILSYITKGMNVQKVHVNHPILPPSWQVEIITRLSGMFSFPLTLLLSLFIGLISFCTLALKLGPTEEHLECMWKCGL